MKPKSRAHSRIARDAITLLGCEIRAARMQRGMPAAELAERAGVSRGLVARVERGEMGSSIGAAFEMAAILGIPLFDSRPEDLRARLTHARHITALLPSRARKATSHIDDAF